MLELVVLLVVLLVVVLVPSLIVVRFRYHWLGLILTMLGFEMLGFALLGLPGAAFVEPTEAVMTRLGKNPIPADGAWGTAILVTLLLPLALVPAWLLTRRSPARGFWSRVIVFGSLFFVGACAVSVAAYLLLV